MFSSIGWGEIVVLGLAALFIFGPERLPHLARDAAAGLKRARGAMTGARGQLHDVLGPDFDHLKDVDLRQYHPRSMLRRALIDEDDDPSGRDTGTVAHLAAGRARVADGQRSPHDDEAT
ncbi:twin-arginine translocase TatA/TatE family subunit [Blastococcus sp. CT_GayMR16]|uniref:twin-arginine translocase TatA/TatE family subunit n=1 Tax=Blastococcus sp. CT_GayMR16 TaxID=2559607 RepID=UPI001073C312|nr:twin-arginine translocase TatA/TatE family subunit [Blastococcus sp. CT_GayMR16]TFV89800.1 translocase [Blastococcus sp. CT_GayMR16]